MFVEAEFVIHTIGVVGFAVRIPRENLSVIFSQTIARTADYDLTLKDPRQKA